jgi:tartrate dehydrogenase/decarboxylase/D-malate dehydrogenase
MTRTNRVYRIAVIAGDGIGKEVMPEGMRVLEAASKKYGFELRLDEFDFSSCDYYAKHGKMLPDDWKEKIGGHDAIYFGAVGMPAQVPDHISLWGSLLLFRREFDQYVNLRPVRLMPGVPGPLANRKPGDIDFFVVRENTEGEYSSVGGRMYAGTEREIVLQETVMSRVGVDRVLKYAFELAQRRPRKKLTSATKSNGISITMPYWDERVKEMAKNYPSVAVDQYHIDILTAHCQSDRPDLVGRDDARPSRRARGGQGDRGRDRACARRRAHPHPRSRRQARHAGRRQGGRAGARLSCRGLCRPAGALSAPASCLNRPIGPKGSHGPDHEEMTK